MIWDIDCNYNQRKYFSVIFTKENAKEKGKKKKKNCIINTSGILSGTITQLEAKKERGKISSTEATYFMMTCSRQEMG